MTLSVKPPCPNRRELRESAVSFSERLVLLAETEPDFRPPLVRALVEAAAGHGRHPHIFHQVPRELDIVAEAERADVGHDVVRTEGLVAREVMALEHVEQHIAAA